MDTLRNILVGLVLITMIGGLVFAPVGVARAAQPAASTPAWQSGILPATTSLTAEETAAILYMREEEKLARDVYTFLYARWRLSIFRGISQSEQMHMDAVKTLIDHYGLTDPVSPRAGVFTNPVLQALYDVLIVRGQQSISEALKVGGAIEEIDILDLDARLAQTNKTDITNVFTNIREGSYHHLRAFVSTLSNQTGEVYQPQYMDLAYYEWIISGGSGGGGGGGGGGCGGGGGGGGHGGPGGRR